MMMQMRSLFWPKTGNAWRGFARYVAPFLLILCLAYGAGSATVVAQPAGPWSPQQTIPNYDPETAEPPKLITDQNKTVHAFSHQQVGDIDSEIAIVYNQWTLEQGWSEPVDIVLSPIKEQARLLGVTLDDAGLFHLLFFGGDETESYIYYTRAAAVNADATQSWSTPVAIGEDALTPENGGIATDGKGKLVAVYNGKLDGRAWYMALSTDGGNSWTEAYPFFPLYDEDLTPTYLRMFLGQSGLLHTVWTVNDKQNHGTAVYYGTFDFEEMNWGDAVQVAATKGGLGTLAPSLIEYRDALFVLYYEGTTGKQYLRRSTDGGLSWTEPVTPFPHVGLNGPGFFVVDSNDDLHLLWSQRISGSPDIHGLWHTVWQNGQWSPYEAVVSGPRISDEVEDRAFDPVTPIVAIPQGNVLLVVWRSDYGLKANGIWYSYKVLDTPQLPIIALPTQPALVQVAATELMAATASPAETPTAALAPRATVMVVERPTTNIARNPAVVLWFGLLPAVLLVSMTILFRQLFRVRNRT